MSVGPDTGPFYVQEKLNGVGFRARLGVYGSVKQLQLWTVRDKQWTPGFFGRATECWLKSMLDYAADHFVCNPVIYGEIVAVDPKTPLATLAGAVSVNSTQANPAVPVIFRCYDIDLGVGYPFSARHRGLQKTYYTATDAYGTHSAPVDLVTTRMLDHVVNIEDYYRDILESDGEGVIIRIDPCFMCEGRSPLMFKWKRSFEAEGTCVGVEEGEGKRLGFLGVFLVEILNPKTNQSEVIRIGGGIGLSDELLAKYFTNPPIGKQLTYTFEERSVNGLPLRPQFVAIRDYE